MGPNGVSAFASKGDIVYAGAGDGCVRRFQGADVSWAETAQARLGSRILSLNLLAGGSGGGSSAAGGADDSGDELLITTAAGALWRLRASDLTAVKVGEAVTAPATAVAFGRQRSDQFATLSQDGALKVWDLNTYLASAACASPTGQPLAGSVLHYSADGQTIIAGYVSGRLSGFSAEDAAERWNIPQAHRGHVNCLTVTERLLVSGGADGVTRVWLAGSRQFVTQLNSHAMKPVVGVAIDCRQPHLLHSAGLDRSVTVFDLKTEGRVVTHQIKEGANMTALAQRADSEQESITATSDGYGVDESRDGQEAVHECLRSIFLTFFAYPLLSPTHARTDALRSGTWTCSRTRSPSFRTRRARASIAWRWRPAGDTWPRRTTTRR